MWICIEFENATAVQKQKLEEKYTYSQNNKTIAQDLKSFYKPLYASDHSEIKKCTAFDLQKALILPYGEHSGFYYTQNFSVYNFTLMDMVSKQGYCYMWDQTIPKHGSSGTASYIYSYIKDDIENSSVEEITMYCDNCTGQKKKKIG